jgi:hypothetical protein
MDTPGTVVAYNLQTASPPPPIPPSKESTSSLLSSPSPTDTLPLPVELLPTIFSFACVALVDALYLALVCKTWSSVIFNKISSEAWRSIARNGKVLKHIPNFEDAKIRNWYSYVRAKYGYFSQIF